MIFLLIPIVGYAAGWIGCNCNKEWSYSKFIISFVSFSLLAAVVIGCIYVILVSAFQSNLEIVETKNYNILTIQSSYKNEYTIECEDIKTGKILTKIVREPIIDSKNNTKHNILEIHSLKFKNKFLKFFIPYYEREYKIYINSSFNFSS